MDCGPSLFIALGIWYSSTPCLQKNVYNKFRLILVCPPLGMISGFSAGHKKCFVVKSRVAETRSYLVGNGSTSATLSIITHQITTIINMQIWFICKQPSHKDDRNWWWWKMMILTTTMEDNVNIDDSNNGGDDDDDVRGWWAEASHNGFPMGHNGDWGSETGPGPEPLITRWKLTKWGGEIKMRGIKHRILSNSRNCNKQ